MRKLIAAALAALALFSFAGCSSSPAKPSAQQAEDNSRQSTYDRITKQQPSHTLSYSPTRDTKNFWIDTWGQKAGKLSYVYMQNQQGQVYGYYVFKGLPVSYCTSLVPPYQFQRADLGEYNGDVLVPGPSVDGTFNSGGDCGTKYGIDATTGAYVEFNAGMGGYILFDQPMKRYETAQPLGPTDLSKK